ncbi:MAG: HAD-IIIC family phosphatase [Planctomycetes bacterium]|nr:HAD-IIIC family phosphatase [Planctomycetota bacterium]
MLVTPFGRFEQELIDPSSNLAEFDANVVLLAVRLCDVCPEIHEEFNRLTSGEATALLDGWFVRLSTALRSFRSRSKALVLIQNYEMPAHPAMGIAEATGVHSQCQLIHEANRRLILLAREFENMHVMDYDALVACVGREAWCDDRMRLFARIPVASAHYWRLAGFYVRHLRPLYGLAKKVLVLDADHTLWGGVVGDVGVHGIQLGHDFPGNAFVEFQKKILDLHRRGVVLAIASKNESGIVEQVLSEHPDMVLKREHFSAMRVNWKPKPDNLREIAAELNLGIDSFVFIDDSPVECDLMRKTLPEVLTIQLPKDPAGYPRVADHLDCFDQWTVSEEDRRRGALYRAESERKQLQANVIDMPTFYRQLEMRMTVYINDESHVARTSQMTNRTNQFNMHTQRCSEDDIRRFMNDGEHELVTVALADRFGDNGVIGMTLIRRSGMLAAAAISDELPGAGSNR